MTILPRRTLVILITTMAGMMCLMTTTAFGESGPSSLPQVLLARDGQAQLPIIISPRAGEGVRQVAAELAGYLRRITGAEFAVASGDGSRGLVLGTLADFPDSTLAAALEIRHTYDGKEAYAIRTEANRVRLLGNTELGVSHAVFRLLEHLGCRWFFPAPEWEVVPRQPTLSVAWDETDRPALLARRIWWGWGFFDHDRGVKEYQAWARHNRMAASLTISCGHAWQTIIDVNRKTFEAHPEYLALVKGHRQGEQFCVSNPAVRQLVRDYAVAHFDRHPELDMVSLETSDGDGHCECEPCVRLGSISERVFGMANEAARAVAAKHPGKLIGLYAYNDHCEPPSFALEPNVYVQSTAGFIRGKYTFEELMEVWPQRCRNLGFYDYFSVWLWDWDLPPGGRAANIGYLRKQIPQYKTHGATSVDCESGNNWGLHGLGYYIANKLLWNPQANVETLLTDFFQQAFGPAAAVMRRYYERLDAGHEPLLSEHLLALVLRDLEEATRVVQQAAADAPGNAEACTKILARLDHLKQYQHYVRLRWDYDRAPDVERRRDLALAVLTHVYRTRYSYMNHWEAIRQSWTPTVAKAVERPSWNALDPAPDKPWRVESPCTAEETARLFREDLARFQPEPIEEKKFSPVLVPLGVKTERPAVSSQRYQGPARYVLYSLAGEELQLTITTGVIAWYRDRPQAVYTVRDDAGGQIAQGRLPQDGQEHPLTIKVPNAGLYGLEFNDQAAGWGLTAPAGRPVSLVLRPGSNPAHMGHMQRMYFYVPRGTRQIQYYWSGHPHEICGPDGKLLASITSQGKFVTIPVPPNSDGQVWSFNKLCLGRLWFFNIPNYLAASPDALLIPREVKRN